MLSLNKRSERLNLLYKNNCDNNHLYSQYQNYFEYNSFEIKASISTKDFSKMNIKEKELFYLENNISLKNKRINPALIDDIIAHFIYHRGGAWKATYFKTFINKRLDTCLDDKEKSKLIRKEFKKYSQKLNKIHVYFDYSQDKEYYQIYYKNLMKNFIGLVSIHVEDFIDNMIVSYLNRDQNCFYSINIFEEWQNIEVYRSILEYLKSCYRDCNPIEPVVTTNLKPLSVNQATILVDKLKTLDIDVWDNIPKTKKAKIISVLINKNEDNIKKGLTCLEKTTSGRPLQFQKDQIYIEELFKNILLT